MSANLNGEPHNFNGGGGHHRQSRRRNGGANAAPTLPLLNNPLDLFLDAHPDGTRTTPHRTWQANNRGGSAMYSHTAAATMGNSSSGGFEQSGRSGHWSGGNGKGLLPQQQPTSAGSYNSSHHGGGHHHSTGGGGGGVRRSLGPRAFNNKGGGGGSPTSGSPATSLGLIRLVTGEAIQFTETNMDWTKLNIFRTRLCDRLTQMHSCHMANRCLFSHDIAWPRRTPFLPRATALTLRYIPVWCPRVPWPPLGGVCDSLGKISWSSTPSPDGTPYDPRYAHSCCIRGENCPFVHNLEEFLYHPEVYKTRMCCLANDDANVGDENGNCLCPWYFCPFAHYLYELRDVRQARHAWHPPPQIVDNHFVARTQGFDEVELTIIQYVRKSPNGSIDLYLRHAGGSTGRSNSNSPHSHLESYNTSAIRDLLFGRYLLPPVFRPIIGSSLEGLVASDWHRKIEFDDLLYLLVIASLLNLALYPVENFYVPALLSLQNAAIEYQLGIGNAGQAGSTTAQTGTPPETRELLALYDKVVAGSGLGGTTNTTAQETDDQPESWLFHGSTPVVRGRDDEDINTSRADGSPQADPISPSHSNISARGSQHTQHQQRSPSPLLSADHQGVTLPTPFSFIPNSPPVIGAGGGLPKGTSNTSLLFNASQAPSSPASSSWRGGSEHAANSPHSLPRFFNNSGRYDPGASGSPSTTTASASSVLSKVIGGHGGAPSGSEVAESSGIPAKLTSASECELESFLELLCPEDLLRVVELFTNENSGARKASEPAETAEPKKSESGEQANSEIASAAE